jgi:hypothetical protein
MSNVTPINSAVAKDLAEAKPEATIRELLSETEIGTTGINVSIAALQRILGELDDVGHSSHDLYAPLYLIREKLRTSIEEIERAMERARAVIHSVEPAEAQS